MVINHLRDWTESRLLVSVENAIQNHHHEKIQNTEVPGGVILPPPGTSPGFVRGVVEDGERKGQTYAKMGVVGRS